MLTKEQIQEKTECLVLFKEYLVYILEYDGLSLVDDLNLGIIDLLSNDPDFKNELEKAILNNQEKIGERSLNLDNKQVEPAIANWIKDFIKSGLIDKGLNFDKGAYFTKSNNFLILKEQDKQLITRLFDLYWQLKFFPDSLAGLPLEDWYIVPYNITEESKIKSYEKKFLPRGEKTTPLEQPADANQQLIKIYYQTLDKYSSVNLEKNSLQAKTTGQNNLLVSELVMALKNNQTLTALAVLEILAENHNLAQLKVDPQIVLLFQKDKKLPATVWQADFGITYLKEFLIWLLIDKLQLIENEAAVFALKLANILRRNGDDSFMKIAYGDAASQSFKFSE